MNTSVSISIPIRGIKHTALIDDGGVRSAIIHMNSGDKFNVVKHNVDLIPSSKYEYEWAQGWLTQVKSFVTN